MTALSSINKRRAKRWQPPKLPRSIVDFAKTIVLPDGTSEKHLWVPSSEPAQLAFLREYDSGNWRKFVVVAPSQRGKTLKAILCPMLHAIIERRQSVGYVMPNLDKLAQNWETKIKPAIHGTGYGKWLPTKGPGSKDGRPAVLTMRDPATTLIAGRVVFMALGGGGRETSVSSVSTSTVMLDEADDAQDVGQIGLVFKRAESFGPSGVAIIASTVNQPKEREHHPVLDARDQGTCSRLHHKCPHCAGFFIPDIEHVNFDDACVVCPLCAVQWSEDDRASALNSSLLVAKTQKIVVDRIVGVTEGNTFSMTTTGLDYHWRIEDKKTGLLESPLPTICADYRSAKIAESKKDPSLMKLHMNKVWCRHYEAPEADGEISNKSLAASSDRSTYAKRMVPTWASFLTMAQDVQGDRHYWLVVANGPGERWAIVDWGYELLVPMDSAGKPVRAVTPADRQDTLNLIRDKADQGWQVEGGESRMRPVMRGVDIGWLTDEIAAWVQGEPSWKAVRGVGEDEAKHVTGGHEKSLPEEIKRTKSIVVRRPPGWRIYWHKVDGHHFRRAAHAALLRDPDAQASGQVPRGLKSNDMLLLHLSGEIWKDDKPGKPGYWFEARKRHDLLDCLIYALALALLHRYAPERRDDGDEVPALPPPPPVPLSQSGWIDSVMDDGGGSSWING